MTPVDKLFMPSVAVVRAYDTNGNEVFTGKTLMNSGITIKSSNADVRGGVGNVKEFVYWHSSDWSGTIEDCQFNLAMIQKSLGSTLVTGQSVYISENVTLGAGGTGTVIAQPITDNADNITIYGWVTNVDGLTEKVTFTGKNFTTTIAASGAVVCVYFYSVNASAKSITVNANIVPSIVRLVMDVPLASSAGSTVSTSSVVGKVQILVPRAQLGGSATITMKADAVATTPITYTALSYTNPNGTGGCANTEAYGYITEVFDNANFYDGLKLIAIQGGDFTLAVAGTKTLVVYGIYNDGSISTLANSSLAFSSSVPGKATVGAATGVVAGVASGSTVISVTITAAPQFDSSVTCTVS